MIDRFERRFYRFDRRHGGSGRSRDHHDLEPKQARSLDLGIGCRSTAVLGDHGIDTMLLHQIDLTLECERATVENIVDIDKGERRIDRIDAANQIEMLRSDLCMMSALPAGRQKDTTRGRSECCDRRRNIRHDVPMIACYRRPFGTDERECGDAGAFGNCRGIGRNAFGEGMGCIDKQIIASLHQKGRKPFRAAEAADANRDRLLGRGLRAPGQRQENVEVFPRRKRGGQPARLACATEDQDTGLLHV